jgi:hypothetical protein
MRTFTLEFRRGIGPPLLFGGREPHKKWVKPDRIPHQFLEWALVKEGKFSPIYRSEASWQEILDCASKPEVLRVTQRGPMRVFVTVTGCGCNIGRF